MDSIGAQDAVVVGMPTTLPTNLLLNLLVRLAKLGPDVAGPPNQTNKLIAYFAIVIKRPKCWSTRPNQQHNRSGQLNITSDERKPTESARNSVNRSLEPKHERTAAIIIARLTVQRQ